MMFVYNDFKRAEILNNKNAIKPYHFIVNNTYLSPDDLLELKNNSIYYCIKLFEGDYRDQIYDAYELGYRNIAIDAENYRGDLKYSKLLGIELKRLCSGFQDVVLLPENLGGDKYKNYNDFILGLNPDKVLMERLYQQPEPWNMITIYLRNIFLRLYGIDIYIGIWPDAVDPRWRKIQFSTAKILSGNRIFWYSERAVLP
jgi:hypothetical protein